MTASTLYEAVEPQVVWKQLLTSIISEITGGTPRAEAICMTKFLLETFQVQDEEVQTIHLPIVFSAISESIRVCTSASAAPQLTVCAQACLERGGFKVASSSIREALALQEEILRHIPAIALKLRPRLHEKSQTAPSQGPLEFACSFYGIERPPVDPIQRASVDKPFVTAFEDLVVLTTAVATNLANCTPELAHLLRDAFSQSVLLVMRLLGRIDQKSDAPFDIEWDPSEWLTVVLESVGHTVRNKIHTTPCIRVHFGFTGFDFHNGRSCNLFSCVPPSLKIGPTQIID